MNRYERTFGLLRDRGEAAFIPFAMAGDPDLRTSEAILRTMVEAGADILEIGYPFSDPIADGPVNQRAAARALAAGLTPERFLALIRRVRRSCEIPIGLLLYANTILHRGIKRFCCEVSEAGVDSLLIADMPPEESGEIEKAMRAAGLCRVFIVSELTPRERAEAICRNVDAFVYVVSRLGPTGAQRHLSTTVADTLRRVRPFTSRPLCVGFGLSSPAHVAAVRQAGADGAIVGSALVAHIERLRERPRTLLKTVEAMVAKFKAATR